MNAQEITALISQAIVVLNNSQHMVEVEQIKAAYLGKRGQLTLLMQGLKDIADKDLRKTQAITLNHLKSELEAALSCKIKELSNKEVARQAKAATIDVTLPAREDGNRGGLHPVSLSLERMTAIFAKLGFIQASGYEIESDYYNFTALNVPNNHPARAMQDTFYVAQESAAGDSQSVKLNQTADAYLLRTHTSPIQIRYANTHKPPIKIIAPGRVYRVDMDATHSPMFHQMEGLWIDKGLNFSHLKGLIVGFLRQFFAITDLEVRFRASFFPFTEPSAEVDIKSASGDWLEVMGCGMVHPNVLANMGIDDGEYSGIAFGVGIDRFAMLYYGIRDLRLLFENNLDFLRQLKGRDE